MDETREYLNSQEGPLPLSALASYFSPEHDLETIALWLSLAREAEVPIPAERESFTLAMGDGMTLQYSVPKVALSAKDIQDVDLEDFDG